MSAEGSSDRKFVITRTFDAPRDPVWKAFTESERMAQWWERPVLSYRVSCIFGQD
jgi:uncharacterized protein YndB with AHSA1/START domain